MTDRPRDAERGSAGTTPPAEGAGSGREPDIRDGVLAGVLGGGVVVVFFFFLDLAHGEPFRTPSFLAGAILAGGAPDPGPVLIGLFTLFHFLAFAAIGAGAVLLFRWAGLSQNVLLGGVYGLFVASLLFYLSLIATGAEVLPAPWWPAVLVGNLLAGLAMGAYLHWVGPRPGVTGLGEQLRRHRTIREGLVAGAIGAVAVAGWFLIADTVLREPLFTPGALGSALFLGAESPEAVRITAETVLSYTAVHLAAFLLFGLIASGLVAQAERFPPFLFAILLLFVVFEVLFFGLAAMLGAWILEELAWWSVLAGNLLAAGAMGGYLWRAHPVLRREVREGALWARR